MYDYKYKIQLTNFKSVCIKDNSDFFPTINGRIIYYYTCNNCKRIYSTLTSIMIPITYCTKCGEKLFSTLIDLNIEEFCTFSAYFDCGVPSHVYEEAYKDAIRRTNSYVCELSNLTAKELTTLNNLLNK